MGYLAACAMFRDESPYLAEWVEFHLRQGVEHLYLLDNDDGRWVGRAGLEPYLARGLVTVWEWPGTPALLRQIEGYGWALRRCRHRWLACIDSDEFLFSPGRDLRDTLAGFEGHAGLAANCFAYGDSEREAPPARQVADLLLRGADGPWHWPVKLVVQPRHVQGLLNPHQAVVRGDRLVVDEDGTHVPGGTNERCPRRLVRVNHYQFRSRADYEAKVRRWAERDPRERKGRWYAARYNRNEVRDASGLEAWESAPGGVCVPAS